MKTLSILENTKILTKESCDYILNGDNIVLLNQIYCANNMKIKYVIPSGSNVKVINIYYNNLNDKEVPCLIYNDWNLDSESNLEIYEIDASLSSYKSENIINLNGYKASCNYNLSTLSTDDFKKESIIHFKHKAKKTFSLIKSFSILKDRSLQNIKCKSQIYKGMSGSEAHQELRLLVFDKSAKAISDPILLIDENDIVASHANAVGMLDANQIFYLKSRGLTETESKTLLCMSYFGIVVNEIEEEQIKKQVIMDLENKISQNEN